MRFPQLIVFEADGRLAALLRPTVLQHGWALREPRRLDAVLGLLQRGGPNVLLIRVGRDLEREFTLLNRAVGTIPRPWVVMIQEADQPRLRGLAWDLGACCVLTLDQPRERLIELVESLLRVDE